jgi:hypothetical protein
MHFWFGVILFALALRPAVAFSPYYSNGNAARWDFNYTGADPRAFNTTTKAIRFYIGNSASTVNRTAELNAIRASFAQWQAIPGTALRFEEAGFAPVGLDDIVLGDGTNSVFWTTRSTVAGVSMIGRSGYTLVALDEQNRIVEADIALNAWLYSWFTDFSNTNSGAQFVETTVLHEIGHLLGLDHTPVGGATVVDGGPGLGPGVGLSSDEIAAARFLYPATTTSAQVGGISGTVRLNGVAIRGAIVTAETTNGIAISSTPSDSSGFYRLPALPPGSYQVHVSPLDSDAASTTESLFRASDIAGDFGSAVTAFKPSENTSATVNAGVTTTLNLNVAAGEPAFRIQQIMKPTTLANAPSPVRYGVAVHPGDSLYVGVYGNAIPPDSTFSITGNGISIHSVTHEPNRFGAQHLLKAHITVATNATSGLRTIVVRRGNEIAYANGYFEIYAPAPDYNFDGLDDRFQRRYFALFTASEAGPTADPDADRFSNAFEALTSSDPTNPASFNFRIDAINIVRGAPRVTWKSDTGKQYQLYGKTNVAGTEWQLIGGPVTAITNETVQIDSIGAGQKYYKLRLLP